MPDISGDRNDLAGSHCSPALGRTLSLEYLKRTIQHIKYLWIGVAMEWNHDSCNLANNMSAGFSGTKMPRSICRSWGFRLFQSSGGFFR